VNERAALLSRLVRDDLFHADASGVSLPCRVLEVTDTIIKARRVTTQELLTYDRHTGVEIVTDGSAVSVIDSVEPLPSDIHDAMLSLDRKSHLIHCLDDVKLLPHEIDALVFIGDHYAENPLPRNDVTPVAESNRPRAQGHQDGEPVPCVMCEAEDGEDPFRKTREELLGRLEPGDLFDARFPSGIGRRIGLVLAVSDSIIRARMIASQQSLDFDRRTGQRVAANGAVGGAIWSVAPLPPAPYNALVNLDRRLRMGANEGGPSETEESALAAANARYDERPLPPR
jgi:hypothetical protein